RADPAGGSGRGRRLPLRQKDRHQAGQSWPRQRSAILNVGQFLSEHTTGGDSAMILPNRGHWPFVAVAIALIVVLQPAHPAASQQRRDPPALVERSWPMFGGSPSRNMVNASESDLPADWCVLE